MIDVAKAAEVAQFLINKRLRMRNDMLTNSEWKSGYGVKVEKDTVSFKQQSIQATSDSGYAPIHMRQCARAG
jgi:hypothetical protein